MGEIFSCSLWYRNTAIFVISLEKDGLIMIRLYDRNYFEGLTEEEDREYLRIREKERVNRTYCRRNLFLSYPKAARMCNSLFPNNYLDVADLKNHELLRKSNEEFAALLDDPNCNERQILNFIKNNRYYHIIGSLLSGLAFHIGHHAAYLFPEFQLGTAYHVDYLIVGKGSGGYEFVLVELENPYGNITLKDGQLGQEFREGISQLEDWRRWLPTGFSSFEEVMRKYKNRLKDLPEEYHRLDLSRFHYVVIAGRRSDFTEKTYIIRREKIKNEDTYILHYDNLIDFSNYLIERNSY